MHKLDISLLGGLAITIDGIPIEVTSNYVRALLLFLVIEAHHPHRREVLAEMLWPEKPAGAARNSLKQALSNLRKALGDRDNPDPFLLVSGDEIQFNQSSHYWVDAAAFAEIMGTCQAHAHDDLVSCQACQDCYLRAVALYGGDFLADFCLPDNYDFNDWITLKREVFQRGISDALSKLAQIYQGRAEIASAIEYSRQLADLEPWNEENHRTLMHLLALNGMRTAALRHYQVCCDNLQRELDVEPSPATLVLYEKIKSWEPGAFPDLEPPQIETVQNVRTIDPEAGQDDVPFPVRSLSRRSFLGLFAAGIVLVIGSVYWSGVDEPRGAAPDKTVREGSQIALAAETGTGTLTPAAIEPRGTEIAQAAGRLSTNTSQPGPTSTPTSMKTTTSLMDSGALDGELQALSALYQQTGGLHWENAGGWLSDRSPCEWHGVTCRGDKIVELDLAHNQLKGTIPGEIGRLESLESLDLRDNQLSGGIPPDIGKLSNLENLFLSGNPELSGPIPPELGNLSHLEILELAHWESGGSLISGEIPPELGKLKRLRSLSISVSLLSGPLPVELCGLTNLEDLYLDNNRLSGPIPPEIGGLINLGTLDLGGNDFEGPIPPELGNLPMLEYLALGDGLVSGEVPAELGDLLRLRYLVLDNTSLSGPLPLSLMNLNLRELTFFGTDLCEPAGDAFQAWLNGINDLHSTGITCKP